MSARFPVLLTSLLILLVCAVPAQAGTLFGFNDNAALYGQATPTAAASAAQAAGATSVRITVDWRAVEPTQGTRDFTRYDAIYNAAVAKGQQPLFVILFAPAWARPAGACAGVSDCTVAPDPSHDADFGAFAAAVAARYPQAAGIEVWNEPNQREFWGGSLPDPARYTQLLKATYTAVKAVDPALPVITGGLTSYGGEDGTGPGISTRAFLDGMYAAGAKGFYDGIGLHPYTSFQLWYGFRAIANAKEAMAANDDPAKLWFTETNVSTTGPQAVSVADQGRYIQRFIPRFRARTDVAGVWIHTLYDPSWVDATSTDRGYGMLTTTSQAKSGYCVLAALYATAICATPAADGTQSARWDAEEKVQAAAEAAIRYRATKGTYTGLTSSVLHALDPTLSAVPLAGNALPGPQVDPASIASFPGADGKSLLLCDASKADRTYCVSTAGSGRWTYGSSTGGIYGTAGAINAGSVWWW
ncbi:MAG: hypothetical protein QOE86_193 [Solirubrobacteraceae bacterium]|nr:hypothetical protein [Solirubrobacteraceae bacterium]